MALKTVSKTKDYRSLFTREFGDRGKHLTKPELVGEVGQRTQPLNNYVLHGAQIPTSYVIRYDGRIRRVYNEYYGYESKLWINIRGIQVYLDPQTAERLEKAGMNLEYI